MNFKFLQEVYQLNPWLKERRAPILAGEGFIPRVQVNELLHTEWDQLWTILVGPRRAGKTTLGKYLSQQLVNQGRFSELLYLNCDYRSIRMALTTPLFISELLRELQLRSPILFIDEVQRVEEPGLLLKAIIDLGLPIKHIATGSSQLEIKSNVQEFLTGRQLTSMILPLSHQEWMMANAMEEVLIYGCYPQVLKSARKEIQLTEIYNRYIQKDIIETLKVGKPDVFEELIALLAHSAGQLVNYNQLATDCKINVTLVKNYLDILEETYIVAKIKPFVGNKRVEITSNPIFYFIDNGFRNKALRNYTTLTARTDVGLLVENFIFQEILKYKVQNYLDFDIHFWRTKSGAEVDFVLYKNDEHFIPVEVKYRNLTKPTLEKGFRSFIEAYQPKEAIIITKDFLAEFVVDGCMVYFIPIMQLNKIFNIIHKVVR